MIFVVKYLAGFIYITVFFIAPSPIFSTLKYNYYE
jgi:hypothetical protein